MASRFEIEAVFKAIDQVTAPIRRMQGSVSRAVHRMDANFQQLAKVGQSVTKTFHRTGLAMGAAMGAAAVGVAAAGKAGVDFEQAITNVGAVSSKTRDQIADLEKKALELGSSTKFTATEVAQGMELMGKAGFSNAEIISGIEGVLAAAAAEGAELAETASTVSNVLKGMGLETAEAGRVADVLALASARTNSTVNSLGESMKNVSPVARQFGIGFEEAVSAVALLQDVGLDASEAGTATATMLTKLAKPSAALEKRMRQMGVAFKDAEGNMLPLSSVLGQLDKAAKKAGGNMDVVAFMADLVGLRGQKAALNLKDMFASGKVGDLAEQLRNAEGAAAKMASIKMDTATGDLLKLGAAVDAVKIALFDTESGPLRGVVQGITEWVDANKDLIVSGFKDFMAFVRDNGELIVDVLSRVAKTAALIYGVATAFKVAAAATKLWTLAAAANPFTLWVIALTALGALIVACWPEISEFFSGVWEWIVEVGSAIGQHLVAAWDAVVGAVRSAFDAVWSVVGPFFTAWTEFQVGMIAIAWEVMKAIGSAIMGVFNTIAGWLRPYWEAFGQMIANAASFYLEIWTGIINAFKGVFSMSWEFIKSGFTAVVEFLGSVWEPQFEIIKSLAEWIVEAFRWAGEKISEVFSPIIDTVSGAIDSVRSIGRSVLGGESDGASGEGAAPVAATASPQESVARSISEHTERSQMEIAVKAEPGSSARVARAPKRGGIKLQPSGAFP